MMAQAEMTADSMEDGEAGAESDILEDSMAFSIEKPIVLVGLMGAGKSAIGKRLAKKLAVPFSDSDREIEEKAGCSIAEIFEMHGEHYFRELEKDVIQHLLTQTPPHVMATGGGAYMNKDTRALISEYGTSIWLRADLPVLLERVSRKHTRPLLEKGDKKAILSRLIEERYPIYAEADFVVDSGGGPHYKVVDHIIWKL